MIAYHEHSKTNNYKNEIDFLGLFIHIKEIKVALITYPTENFLGKYQTINYDIKERCWWYQRAYSPECMRRSNVSSKIRFIKWSKLLNLPTKCLPSLRIIIILLSSCSRSEAAPGKYGDDAVSSILCYTVCDAKIFIITRSQVMKYLKLKFSTRLLNIVFY